MGHAVAPVPSASWADAVQEYIRCREQENDGLWGQADCALRMVARFGADAIAALASEVGVSKAYVRMQVATAKAFPPGTRAQDASFSLHRICAMTEDPEGWLERALAHGWSTRELQEAVRDARDAVDQAEQARRAEERLAQQARRYNADWAPLTGKRVELLWVWTRDPEAS